MTPTADVIDRLLVAKGLLGPIRFAPTAQPDRITLARHILLAHDGAELALAAIARHVGRLPRSEKHFLMDYVGAIQGDSSAEAPGRDYFSQLNLVRKNIKHNGQFPEVRQWFRVGDRTWEYLSAWCEHYLGLSLDDLDESARIADGNVKSHYDAALDAFNRGQFKESLEHLAFANHALFQSNDTMRNLGVGIARAEDALKLAAFGVHTNDYLALQEFLPQVRQDVHGHLLTRWKQHKFGHPGNWIDQTVAFCLRTFVQMAVRIQDAEWIPAPIDFHVLYQHQITALVDRVEITQERMAKQDTAKQEQRTTGLVNSVASMERIVVRTLNKGETLRCLIGTKEEHQAIIDALRGVQAPTDPILSVIYTDDDDKSVFGEVEANKVRAICVPRDKSLVRDYFPDLPEIDYQP